MTAKLPDKLTQSNSLADLAARIQQEHAAVAGALKTSLVHAMAAGDLLIQAKTQVPHGQWLPWLRNHCQVSERMAQRYIRLARNRAVIEAKCDTVSDLGVRGALNLISANRSSSDDFISKFTDFADHVAEVASDFQDHFDTPEIDNSIRDLLFAEARASIERIVELCCSAELADLVERETQDIAGQFIAACAGFRPARAASLGLSVEELDQCDATIQHTKSQGVNDWEVVCVAFKKHPDFWHRDPLPAPTPTAVVSHVRDLAHEYLRQVEMIVARERGGEP
jgi:hypothetical protein